MKSDYQNLLAKARADSKPSHFDKESLSKTKRICEELTADLKGVDLQTCRQVRELIEAKFAEEAVSVVLIGSINFLEQDKIQGSYILGGRENAYKLIITWSPPNGILLYFDKIRRQLLNREETNK